MSLAVHMGYSYRATLKCLSVDVKYHMLHLVNKNSPTLARHNYSINVVYYYTAGKLFFMKHHLLVCKNPNVLSMLLV